MLSSLFSWFRRQTYTAIMAGAADAADELFGATEDTSPALERLKMRRECLFAGVS